MIKLDRLLQNLGDRKHTCMNTFISGDYLAINIHRHRIYYEQKKTIS